MTTVWTRERRLAAGLGGLAILVILVLFIRGLGGSSESEAVTTDVAVHVDTIARATLHRSVTAYGYVEPQPASAENSSSRRGS